MYKKFLLKIVDNIKKNSTVKTNQTTNHLITLAITLNATESDFDSETKETMKFCAFLKAS